MQIPQLLRGYKRLNLQYRRIFYCYEPDGMGGFTSIETTDYTKLSSENQNFVAFNIFGCIDLHGKYNQFDNRMNRLNTWYFTNVEIQSKGNSYGVKTGSITITFNAPSTVNVGNLESCVVLIESPFLAYASLIEFMKSQPIRLRHITMKVPTGEEDQLKHELQSFSLELNGHGTIQNYQPFAFVNQGSFNQNIAEIPCNILVDEKKQIASYLNVQCSTIDLVIYYEEIKKPTIINRF